MKVKAEVRAMMQQKPRNARGDQQTSGIQRRDIEHILLQSLRRDQPYQHLDLGLVASGLLQQPYKADTKGNDIQMKDKGQVEDNCSVPFNESDRFWVLRGDKEHIIQEGEIFCLLRMYSLIEEAKYAFRVKA